MSLFKKRASVDKGDPKRETLKTSSNDKIERLLGLNEPRGMLSAGKRLFKVLVLGEGKSALTARRFREDIFEGCNVYDPTIEDLYSEEIEYKGIKYTLEICDLGNEMYSLKSEKWIKWADAFVIVYLVDSKRSLDLAVRRREDIAKLLSNRYVPAVFVGSKTDCKNREVSTSQGKEKADYFRSVYIETSAATGENVVQAWDLLLEELLKLEQAQRAQNGRKSGWLKKRKNRSWSKRWFVLYDTALRYYANKDDAPKGAISLTGCQMVQDPSAELDLMKKEIKKEHAHIIILIMDKALTYYLECENEIEKFEWREELNNAIQLAKMKVEGVEQKDYAFIGFEAKRMTMDKAKSESVRGRFLASGRNSILPTSETSEAQAEKETNSKLSPEQQNAKLFNDSPKKAVQQFTESGTFKTAHDVAFFLYSEPSLKKVKIGEYLGESDEFAISVMKEYTSLFTLKNSGFDSGLRSFLSKFRLPGEAQKIDRIMECFAKHYCQHNPNSFESEDTAYVLAFSLIMLNTDAHNPAVQRKMTKEQFLSNNRGINNGKDLAPEFLGTLYDSIVTNEIEMDYERDDLSHSDQKGWITWNAGKPGGKFSRIYAIVSGSCLYLFQKPDDSKPQSIVLLANLIVDTKNDETFTLLNPKGKVKAAQGGEEKIFDSISFSVDNWRKRFEWMRALRMNSIQTLTYQ